MGEALEPSGVNIEARFAVGLLRQLVKLLSPEVVGIAAMVAATELGMPRKQAVQLAARLMQNARQPSKRPPVWPWIGLGARRRR